MTEAPKRLNKYLAEKGYATRREADVLIERGLVFVNGKPAVIGQKVSEKDSVEVRGTTKKYLYFVYNKPRGVITHSPQGSETDIAQHISRTDIFPVGRLDKDSSGLIILTNDGRITDRLLSPKHDHEKEYFVTTVQSLRPSFAEHMQKGVNIGLTSERRYVTKPCTVRTRGERAFSITLSEGKKHQIRRMCAALHVDIQTLERVRIMNIRAHGLKSGTYRAIEGKELDTFLSSLGLNPQN